MTRTGEINSTTRPIATRVVDGNEFHIELDLSGVADTLLDQIAQTLHRERRMGQLMLLGNPRVSAVDKAVFRAQLKAALSLNRAFDVPMFPAQAEELQADLFETTVEPGLCEGDCGGENYATRPDGLCDLDGAAADLADAGYAHIRAV